MPLFTCNSPQNQYQLETRVQESLYRQQWNEIPIASSEEGKKNTIELCAQEFSIIEAINAINKIVFFCRDWNVYLWSEGTCERKLKYIEIFWGINFQCASKIEF